MNGTLYDPVGVFCTIALISLHKPETRVDLHNNTVTIQPSSSTQWMFRFNKSSRGDLHALLHPIKRFIELTCLGVDILAFRTPLYNACSSTPAPPLFNLDTDSKSSSPALETASSLQRSESHTKPSVTVNLVNTLYKNPELKQLLRHFQAGIRALQKTYPEDNAEVTLQQAYNVVTDAFELNESGGDVNRALRLLPPSCTSYNSSIMDQSTIINLWSDDSLKRILDLFQAYWKEPLPQNLVECRIALLS